MSVEKKKTDLCKSCEAMNFFRYVIPIACTLWNMSQLVESALDFFFFTSKICSFFQLFEMH